MGTRAAIAAIGLAAALGPLPATATATAKIEIPSDWLYLLAGMAVLPWVPRCRVATERSRRQRSTVRASASSAGHFQRQDGVSHSPFNIEGPPWREHHSDLS